LTEVDKREYLKEIWKNSSQTEKIKFEMSRLMIDLKGEISHFGKDSITRGITKITALVIKINRQLRMEKIMNK